MNSLILRFIPLVFWGLAAIPSVAGVPATTVRLWSQDAPGALGQQPQDIPKLAIHLPDQARSCGTGVVICPGGGYQGLAMGHEGQEIAAWLNDLGVAAFILDYRHRGKGYGHPAPSVDLQRAIRTVRANASSWNVDPQRVGAIGFSAGGHLVATAGTHFDPGRPDAEDPVEHFSCRPDFLILCYPVIAFGESFTHVGSQRNLLGSDPDPELIRALSAEKQVTAETPAHLPVSHGCRSRSCGGKQSGLLCRLAKVAGAGGAARLRSRQPRGGTGTEHPGNFRLAAAVRYLDAGPRTIACPGPTVTPPRSRGASEPTHQADRRSVQE